MKINEDEPEPEEVLIGGKEKRVIEVLDYDKSWSITFDTHKRKITNVLGDVALRIEHIGSTSVPGLAAKPIIDMLLVVTDSADESIYLKKLEDAGYVLRVREPKFHEHRMFRTIDKDVHLHVFSPDSPEIGKYITFRDKLRGNENNRVQYEKKKRELAKQSWDDMNLYSDAKSEIIAKIINS